MTPAGPAALAQAGPVLLVGGGMMGGALARGWRAAGLPPPHLTVVEPAAGRRDALATELPGSRIVGAAGPGEPPAALVLAVKPQLMAAVVPPLVGLAGPATLVLSVAAGTATATLAAWFGRQAGIVRAMPNTPAAIGLGVSALYAGPAVAPSQRQLAAGLMAAVGAVHWLADEAAMHAVTALSGSGPAYLFLLIEAMAAAGCQQGVPAPLALQLARGTVAGAAELARRSDLAPEALRRQVTSPGGTTAAALAVLAAEAGGLPELMMRAMAAAADRSRALG